MDDGYLRKVFPAGTEIFRSGDLGNCAYIIDEGEVEIGIPLNGHQTIHNRLGPGEIFGEMALIDDHKRIGSARAVSDTVMRVITANQILDRLHHADEVIAFILRITLMRYRQLLQQMRRAEEVRDPGRPREGSFGDARTRGMPSPSWSWRTNCARGSTRASFASTSSRSSRSQTGAWSVSRRSCAGRTRAPG